MLTIKEQMKGQLHLSVYEDTKLQAWLTFLSSDSAEDIIKLVTAYPEFKEYYQDIADFRTKPKEWIYMYSKSLAETDRIRSGIWWLT